jgi:hypothetical protein
MYQPRRLNKTAVWRRARVRGLAVAIRSHALDEGDAGRGGAQETAAGRLSQPKAAGRFHGAVGPPRVRIRKGEVVHVLDVSALQMWHVKKVHSSEHGFAPRWCFRLLPPDEEELYLRQRNFDRRGGVTTVTDRYDEPSPPPPAADPERAAPARPPAIELNPVHHLRGGAQPGVGQPEGEVAVADAARPHPPASAPQISLVPLPLRDHGALSPASTATSDPATRSEGSEGSEEDSATDYFGIVGDSFTTMSPAAARLAREGGAAVAELSQGEMREELHRRGLGQSARVGGWRATAQLRQSLRAALAAEAEAGRALPQPAELEGGAAWRAAQPTRAALSGHDASRAVRGGASSSARVEDGSSRSAEGQRAAHAATTAGGWARQQQQQQQRRPDLRCARDDDSQAYAVRPPTVAVAVAPGAAGHSTGMDTNHRRRQDDESTLQPRPRQGEWGRGTIAATAGGYSMANQLAGTRHLAVASQMAGHARQERWKTAGDANAAVTTSTTYGSTTEEEEEAEAAEEDTAGAKANRSGAVPLICILPASAADAAVESSEPPHTAHAGGLAREWGRRSQEAPTAHPSSHEHPRWSMGAPPPDATTWAL